MSIICIVPCETLNKFNVFEVIRTLDLIVLSHCVNNATNGMPDHLVEKWRIDLDIDRSGD